MKLIPEILSKADSSSNGMILDALRRAGEILKSNSRSDYWLSDAGQAELLRKLEDQRIDQEHRMQKDRNYPRLLAPMDYTEATKAMMMANSKPALSSAGGAAGNEEWIEVEMTADTGACDTVMPRLMCNGIQIQQSLQSLNSMEYEVASGQTIPNLGERRCLMWTEGATEARRINLQVADVHKALLSLSRCADMGFESRFGRLAGALIDETSGDVIPLQRQGNLYILKCWLKAAPFHRPE